MLNLTHRSIITDLDRVSESKLGCSFSKLSLGFCPTIENCKGRKRSHSESQDHVRDESGEADPASLTPATIISVNREDSCVPPPTAKRHLCPAPSCTKGFKRVQHLYRHIRNKNNDAHMKWARIIATRWCTPCSKGFARPVGLVKHKRIKHGETYESRLDIVLIRAGLPSPPPETSGASDHTSCRQARRHLIPIFPLTLSSDGMDQTNLYEPLPASEPCHKFQQPFALYGQSSNERLLDNQGKSLSERPPTNSSAPSTTAESYQHPQMHNEQFVINPPLTPVNTTGMQKGPPYRFCAYCIFSGCQ